MNAPLNQDVASLPDSQRGLYGKFIVTRTDGKDQPGMRHEHDQYFVLNLTTDKHAIPALVAYAESCKSEYPPLAADLNRLLSERATKDDEYVLVPETTLPSGLIVPEFEVARYAAGKGLSNTPVSTPTAEPWNRITFEAAKTAAHAAGLLLITETQWLAIAWQIYQQDANWTGGKVGKGTLYQGLHLDTISEPQPGNYEPEDASERRWHVLANGERVYDFAGNLFQWVVDNVQGDADGVIAAAGIAADSMSITTCPDESLTKGTGWRPNEDVDWSGDALIRGGFWLSDDHAGVFYLYADNPRDGWSDIGFRCTKPIGL